MSLNAARDTINGINMYKNRKISKKYIEDLNTFRTPVYSDDVIVKHFFLFITEPSEDYNHDYISGVLTVVPV
jgi:hypothetical protein